MGICAWATSLEVVEFLGHAQGRALVPGEGWRWDLPKSKEFAMKTGDV